MPAPPPDRDDPPASAAAWLAPFLRDASLWPVTAVVVLIFTVFGAAGLLLAFVERNAFAIAAVALGFWVSVDVALRERRRGGAPTLSIALGVLWLASAAGAWAARRWGWY